MENRHIFFGGNTPYGFYSYYDYVLDAKMDRRLYILKGGPGVGKSHFVRRIGEELRREGYSIEELHCSGDGDSLDGIVVKELGVGIIDGTAPHMIDPKIPAAFEEIVNLGEYINVDVVTPHRSTIIQHNEEKARCFKSAYRYLRAAREIDEDSVQCYAENTVEDVLDEIAEYIEKRLLLEPSSARGRVRKMFATAITPEGHISYVDSLIVGTKIIELKGETSIAKRVIEKVYTKLVVYGYDIEACYCPIYPDKIDHLIIPALNVSIVTLNKHHSTSKDGALLIELENAVNEERISKHYDTINNNNEMFDKLMERAVSKMQEAKKIHKLNEEIYIAAMNFTGVDNMRNTVLSKIRQLKSLQAE